MFTKKETRIIQILMDNKEHFVTSRQIATELQCSDRTIRTYYKSLLDKLEVYPGITLEARQGCGYRLLVRDEEVYTQFLQAHNITPQTSLTSNVGIEDRYTYLLNKLLFEQNEIYFDDLVDELFVSRSTLSNDFRKIREDLGAYHLKVESKANKGVYVTGSERDKRHFIMDYFVNKGYIHSMHAYVDSQLLNTTISFEELTIIVLDECREGQLKLSDFVIQNLVIHIALAIRRIAEGFHISKIAEIIDLTSLSERKVAQKILHRISASTGIDFPLEEVDYITLHLISKSYGKARGISEQLVDSLRQDLVSAISTMSPIFEKDFQLLEGLVTHLSTLLIRLEGHVNLENPMTKEIQSQYPDMYVLAEKVMEHIIFFNHYKLSADELAYIALHFMAAKERYRDQHKYSILVICATGYGSAQMLKSRIHKELGSLVHIVDVIGYYEITDDKLRGIDFIISSIDLSRLIFSIPVFTVSVFLDEKEVRTIRQGIAHLSGGRVDSQDQLSSQDFSRIFDDYFTEESFLRLDGGDKYTVLNQLVTSIAEGEDVSFIPRMLELIDQREKMSSVVFSESIVVAHPIKAVGRHHQIALAILPDGLHWDDAFTDIKFVFLTSMSLYDNDGLPELASCLVDLVERVDLQEELLMCSSFQQFKKIFLRIKER